MAKHKKLIKIDKNVIDKKKAPSMKKFSKFSDKNVKEAVL